MIIIKNKQARQKMRLGGQALAGVMDLAVNYAQAGMTTEDLDAFIENEMRKAGLVPVCKGYGGYRHASCISPNDMVIHGVPSKNVVLKDSDFVTLDIVGGYQGYCVDMARSFEIGQAPEKAHDMLRVAQEALDSALKLVKPGIHLSDLSFCIQKCIERGGYGIVKEYAGHGIGKNIHEAPEIPNYGAAGCGPLLRSGMTLAIEPMITEKASETFVREDGWTVQTVDGGLAVHVEDTVLVTDTGVEVLTRKT